MTPTIGTLTALVSALFAAALLCLCATADAAAPKSARCSFLYINGDLVISCPRGTL